MNPITVQIELAAQHVLDYARSKQLRGGWGDVTECYSLEELAEAFADAGVKSKSAGLDWARTIVKYNRELTAQARRELDTQARHRRQEQAKEARRQAKEAQREFEWELRHS